MGDGDEGSEGGAEGALQRQITTRLQPRLNAIEKIRADLGAEGIEVPGVVVAGAQSAGKSSVLETLSGVSLPRGETITTRVPLILRLESDPTLATPRAWVGDNPDVDNKGKEVASLSDIADQITTLTTKLAGSGGRVVDKPIHLKIIKPQGPTMTLIDLPGITHMSVGDEQEDIHGATTALVKKYIDNSAMIIMCVIPATEDFANAEAVKLAKAVDPEGIRTLGVVTKVDYVKAGLKLVEKIHGDGPRAVKLKLGFVAVKNRSAEEDERDLSSEELKVVEQRFFETNSDLKGLDRCYWGIDTLVTKVVDVQTRVVDAFMPTIRARLKEQIDLLEQQLRQAEPAFQDDSSMIRMYGQALAEVQARFLELCRGGWVHIGEENEVDMNVAAETHALSNAFEEKVRKAMPVFYSEDYLKKVLKVLEYTAGASLPNFLSHPAFVSLKHELFHDVSKEASEELLRGMSEYVNDVMTVILKDEMGSNYPRLLAALTDDVLPDLLTRYQRAGAGIVSSMLEAEERVFTINDYYTDTLTKLTTAVTGMNELGVGSEVDVEAMNASGCCCPACRTATVDVRMTISAIAEGGSISFTCPHGKVVTGNWDNISSFPGFPSPRGLALLCARHAANKSAKHHAALHMINSIYAYSKVVRKRMCDVVPMLVHMFLVTHVGTGFLEYATKEEVMPLSRLRGCLAEDPTVAEERKRKQRSLDRYRHAFETLKNVA